MSKLRRVGLVAILSSALAAVVAHAACGDGVVDAGEHCDHGAANGADGCCSADCLLVDRDFDALCDAADGCDNHALDARIKEPRLEIRSTAAGAVLRFRGRITVPVVPAIDPAAQGVRLALSDSPNDGFAEGTRVLDVRLPAGARWTGRADAWTYRDRTGSACGITRMGVKLRPPVVPSVNLVDVVFDVEGRGAVYAVTPDMVTTGVDPVTGQLTGRALVAQVAFVAPDDAANPQCGSVYVTSELATRCAFEVGGVVCQGPRIGGPCRVGDPDDLVVCDVLNAVRAQARWFARRGDYFSGACGVLPGVVTSPGVSCVTAGTADEFQVYAAHPSALRQCTWTSAPGAGQNLVCF